MKRRKSIFLPPQNVIVMIMMLAAITGAIFTVILDSWINGAAVGVLFAAAVYLLIVVDARGRVKKRKR
ncbi:MAG: hypothetical protein ACFE0P_08250 [Oceanicaulis sp.]